MSTSNATDAALQAPDLTAQSARVALRRETGLVLLLLAVLQQSLGHHNPDNSWLFHVCERLLDGARIYLDPIETNPPASFLIYLPAAMLARLMRLPTEFTVSLFVFAAALASMWFSNTIARRAKLLGGGERAFFFNAGIAALLVLPGICFAQREHVAAIAILPMLFVYGARMGEGKVRIGHAIIAGALGGIALAIKPFFAAALLLPLLAVLWKRRSIAVLCGAEHVAAAAVLVAYGAIVYLFFPEFFTVLPALLDTYAAVKMPARAFVLSPFFLIAAILIVTAMLLNKAQERTRNAIIALGLAAGAAGFLLAAFVQGKGWINHFFPTIALGVLALAAAVADKITAMARHGTGAAKSPSRNTTAVFVLPVIMLAPLFFGAPNQFAMQEEYPGLRQAIARHAPPKPKIMSLAVGLDAGFPITRQVDGEWVGRQNMLWQMAFARILHDSGKADATRMQRYVDADARMFFEDASKRKPDIIIAGKGPHIDKIWQHSDIRAAMALYRKAEDVGDVDLWVRKRP